MRWLLIVVVACSSPEPRAQMAGGTMPVPGSAASRSASGSASASTSTSIGHDAANEATAPVDAAPIELAVLYHFGGIDVIETLNEARYQHGGAPAPLHSMSINFDVRDARAHVIEVKKLELVNSNCGEVTATKKRLSITGHELYTWDSVDPIATGAASVTTPAGGPNRLSVNVSFAGESSYNGCGYVVDLVVDRVRKSIELPLDIKRMEPLRR